MSAWACWLWQRRSHTGIPPPGLGPRNALIKLCDKTLLLVRFSGTEQHIYSTYCSAKCVWDQRLLFRLAFNLIVSILPEIIRCNAQKQPWNQRSELGLRGTKFNCTNRLSPKVREVEGLGIGSFDSPSPCAAFWSALELGTRSDVLCRAQKLKNRFCPLYYRRIPGSSWIFGLPVCNLKGSRRWNKHFHIRLDENKNHKWKQWEWQL